LFAVRKLAHIARLKARIGWQNLRTEEFVEEGPFCVTGTDFQNGSVNWSTCYRVSPERYEIDRNIHLQEGDLLITKDGTIGKVAVVRNMPGPATLNSGVFLLRSLGEGLDTTFMKWIVQSKVFDDFVAYNSTGSTINHLYQNVFEQFRFPYPDRTTQKTIAGFLDRETARIDRLIETKQRLVGVLKERELAHIAYKFSQLDARTWRVRHLGKLKNGAGFPVELQGDPSQNIAFFKVKHLKVHGLDAAIAQADDTVSEETAHSLRATVFPKGTIVFAKIGAALLLGRFSMLGRTACIDNNMAAFIPNEKLIEPNFALLGLSQADMTTMVQPGAVPSLSTEAFYSFGIPLPSKETQRNFVDAFRSWRSTTLRIIDKTERSIALLRERRTALITAAVTGQMDVAAWDKQERTGRRLDEAAGKMQA